MPSDSHSVAYCFATGFAGVSGGVLGKRYSGIPIKIVELSDKTSYMKGVELSTSTFSTRATNDTTLATIYTASNFTVTKTKTLRHPQVSVRDSSAQPAQY